jgi:hypothetical protein
MAMTMPAAKRMTKYVTPEPLTRIHKLRRKLIGDGIARRFRTWVRKHLKN